jgi:anti-sigma regulatory factor (Ser/Thr protein kinase)
MASSVLASCLWPNTEPGSEVGWTWESRSCVEEASPVVELVAAAMAREGYPDHDIFEMRLALRDALCNAIHRGNHGDPEKLVRVACDIDGERVLVDVRDEGPGFDAAEADAEMLAQMRLCLSWVLPGEPGNGVVLCKYRSEM